MTRVSVRARLLGVLWTAGAVSVACNILAAEPTVVGRGVAAWPPIALMLVVEVLARSPLPHGRLRYVAAGGAGAVAVTAALASFHHMHEVALVAGESELVAWLFPLTVDGLAVVASVALVGQHNPAHLEHDQDLDDDQASELGDHTQGIVSGDAGQLVRIAPSDLAARSVAGVPEPVRFGLQTTTNESVALNGHGPA
jgi:hypothetical protein